MKLKAVFYSIGKLLFIMSGFLLIPALVSFYYHENEVVKHFLMTAVIVLSVGAIFLLIFRKAKNDTLKIREGFLLVTLSWLFVSFFGAMPFHFARVFPSFIDAFFEATSGFTTTGASVLTNIEALSHGLLFWRSFTHWIGGMGIIVLAVAILPQLSIGGMQLMRNETPGPTFEQLKPRIKQTALTLWKVYILFSVLEIFFLYLFGMSLFDSVCHMFGTMGTGGFSTRNASIGAFSVEIQMVIVVFMFLAGMNFVLHYRFLKGDYSKPFKDAEWRFYAAVILVAFFVVVINLIMHSGMPLLKALRLSIFQVVSITTTTGYVTTNFNAWPELSRGIIFLLMIVGGCAGSTGGGLKQIRLILLFKRAKQSITQHIFPKAIVPIKMDKKVIPEGVVRGVINFLLIYIVIFSICAMILLMFNLDFVTTASAIIACMSNIGPGFGAVGATQNYAFLPATVKAVLCACMIIGRLEIYTVLVLFFPTIWRK